jgi:hypothetical protein
MAVPGHCLVVQTDDVAVQAADLTTKHSGKVAATCRHTLYHDYLAHPLDTRADPPSWRPDRIDQHDPLRHSGRETSTRNIIGSGIRITHTRRSAAGRCGAATPRGHQLWRQRPRHSRGGTVGGCQYGLAKARPRCGVAVRVLSCAGSGTVRPTPTCGVTTCVGCGLHVGFEPERVDQPQLRLDPHRGRGLLLRGRAGQTCPPATSPPLDNSPDETAKYRWAARGRRRTSLSG